MEFIVIVLSSLIGIASPTGLVVDRVVENAILDQLSAAEDLQVRIDNTPSHQLLQGKIDRLRISGHGLFPRPGIRIETLDLETDAIDLDMEQLRQGTPVLEKPLQAMVHLVVQETDLNRALRSPAVVQQLRDLSLDLFGADALSGYDFENPQVEFLGENRLRFRVRLQERSRQAEPIDISTEVTLGVDAGHRVELRDPALELNGEAFPASFVEPIFAGLSQQLDLKALEESDLLVRLLELQIDRNQVSIVSFVQVAATGEARTR